MTHPGPPLPIEPEPNATWTSDFKGEFRTGDGQLCYPLTIQDGHTRFLLECRAMPRFDMAATLRSLGRLFRDFGLPRRIRTDNGPPLSSTARTDRRTGVVGLLRPDPPRQARRGRFPHHGREKPYPQTSLIFKPAQDVL